MSGAPPPPPPPPHGESPKTTSGSGSGLPPGKYDVFIIPEHSAGSGFLYLPSLRTNTNSFIAGFASALIMVVLGQSMAPAFQAWWANFQGMGNAGMLLLVIAVGLGAWSLGRQSSDGTGRDGAGGGGGFYSGGSSMPGGGGFSSAGSSPHSAHHGSPPGTGPPPDAHSPPPPPGGSKPSANQSNGSYQRPPQPPPQPTPQPNSTKPQAETPKNSWQKARDEVRRKEEERKAKEAEEKRRAEAAQRLKDLREKEARERAQREAERTRREQEAKDKLAQEQAAKEKEAREKEDKERKEKEQREAREKELRERLAREREERRKKLEEDRRRREEAGSQARSTSSYAYSGVGEKTSPWPNGKPPTPSSPTKKPPPPTAKTFVGDDSDAYSYRPYDQPKRPARRMSKSDISESSWAPSQSTARTSPPPSVRGPYSTKDPDKIVIKAVYCFMNQFAKTPASQLVSGVGTVTDGLILRITTEGLFIDDDIRGVAQREWDVKAWTLKMVEVWCPVHFLTGAIAANSPSPTGSKSSSNPALSANHISTAFFAKVVGGGARLRAAERGSPKSLSGDEADAYLADVLRSCKDSCRLGDCASKFAASNLPSSSGYNDDASSVTSGSTRVTNSTAQTGDWKAKGLHLLRATIRDQEGKRYMFVIGEEDGWKVAVGLQRLRRGTQVRALGVAGLSGLETKSTLEMLGWG